MLNGKENIKIFLKFVSLARRCEEAPHLKREVTKILKGVTPSQYPSGVVLDPHINGKFSMLCFGIFVFQDHQINILGHVISEI